MEMDSFGLHTSFVACWLSCYANRLGTLTFLPGVSTISHLYPPPRSNKQWLTPFSNNDNSDVRKIAQLALKEKYEFVDCVGEEESTHQHVPQQYVVCSQEQQVWGCSFSV